MALTSFFFQFPLIIDAIMDVVVDTDAGKMSRRTRMVFSERKVVNILCCRPSICLSSVTFMHPTQPVEIFGNVFTPFGTLAIC